MSTASKTGLTPEASDNPVDSLVRVPLQLCMAKAMLRRKHKDTHAVLPVPCHSLDLLSVDNLNPVGWPCVIEPLRADLVNSGHWHGQSGQL